MSEKKTKKYHCPLDVTMDRIGGKWKAVVLWYLRNSEKRFGELGKSIPEITEKMLSLTLKQLEYDGLITRTAYPEVPPRVEYALTKEGKKLVPALTLLVQWGKAQGIPCGGGRAR